MRKQMRAYHRYLGFFLSGIMLVYALSGVILIFRDTEFLKVEKQISRQLESGLNTDGLGQVLRKRGFRAQEENMEAILFEGGSYNKGTGLVSYRSKELPVALKKMIEMHKASTDQPLFYLNIFFGASLLFFVISSFFMFLPKSKIFRNGIYVALAGMVFTVIVVYI